MPQIQINGELREVSQAEYDALTQNGQASTPADGSYEQYAAARAKEQAVTKLADGDAALGETTNISPEFRQELTNIRTSADTAAGDNKDAYATRYDQEQQDLYTNAPLSREALREELTAPPPTTAPGTVGVDVPQQQGTDGQVIGTLNTSIPGLGEPSGPIVSSPVRGLTSSGVNPTTDPQATLPPDVSTAPDPTVAEYFQNKAELEAVQKTFAVEEGDRATFVANPEERAEFVARLEENNQRLESELEQKGLLSAVQQAEQQDRIEQVNARPPVGSLAELYPDDDVAPLSVSQIDVGPSAVSPAVNPEVPAQPTSNFQMPPPPPDAAFRAEQTQQENRWQQAAATNPEGINPANGSVTIDLGDGRRETINRDGSYEISGGDGTFRFDAAGKETSYTTPAINGVSVTTTTDGVTVTNFQQGPLTTRTISKDGELISTDTSYTIGDTTLRQTEVAGGEVVNSATTILSSDPETGETVTATGVQVGEGEIEVSTRTSIETKQAYAEAYAEANAENIKLREDLIAAKEKTLAGEPLTESETQALEQQAEITAQADAELAQAELALADEDPTLIPPGEDPQVDTYSEADDPFPSLDTTEYAPESVSPSEDPEIPAEPEEIAASDIEETPPEISSFEDPEIPAEPEEIAASDIEETPPEISSFEDPEIPAEPEPVSEADTDTGEVLIVDDPQAPEETELFSTDLVEVEPTPLSAEEVAEYQAQEADAIISSGADFQEDAEFVDTYEEYLEEEQEQFDEAYDQFLDEEDTFNDEVEEYLDEDEEFTTRGFGEQDDDLEVDDYEDYFEEEQEQFDEDYDQFLDEEDTFNDEVEEYLDEDEEFTTRGFGEDEDDLFVTDTGGVPTETLADFAGEGTDTGGVPTQTLADLTVTDTGGVPTESLADIDGDTGFVPVSDRLSEPGEVSDTGGVPTQTLADLQTDPGLLPDQVEAQAAAQKAAITEAAKQRAQAQAVLAAQRKQANDGDWRVKLRLAPAADYLYRAAQPGILQPLSVTDGVVFPYTPQITTAYKASYNAYDLTHSNYRGYFYQGSQVEDIQINAVFTAQDSKEAEYLLAVIHFFRSATKMFYGQDAQRGAPPPLVFLQGFGEYQFNLNPCVITQFNYVLPSDVDYIRAGSPNINGTNLLQKRDRQNLPTNPFSAAWTRLKNAGAKKGAIPTPPAPPTLGTNRPTYVPTKIDINVILHPIQSREQVSKQFSVKQYANGDLLKGGFW